MRPARRTLLVIRPTGLGDLVMSIPALRALRRAFGDAEFVTTCPDPLVPLARLVGVADRFVTERSGPAGPVLDAARHRATNAAILDRVFAEPRRPAETVVALKMPEDELSRRVLDRRPERVVCYRHPAVPATHAQPRYHPEDHVLVRWERLLGPSGIAPDRADLYLALPPGPDPAADAGGDGPPTVVHLGAGSPSRRWPLDRWAAVVAALAADGHRVVCSGSAGERDAVAQVLAAAGVDPRANLAGTTDPVGLARLVRSARLVVAPDTGVPHLAVLFRRPSLTLFGPTPPQEWGPPPERRGHRVLWTGRTGIMYGPDADPGLLQLTVDEVVAAARQVDADPAGTGPDGTGTGVTARPQRDGGPGAPAGSFVVEAAGLAWLADGTAADSPLGVPQVLAVDDLWSGNLHTDTGGRPWLVDPAAYGGHREVDLAMLALFGGGYGAAAGSTARALL